MDALRVESGCLVSKEIPAPAANGEALVRVTMSGICNTDLEIARGYMGFEGTLGHEFVGVALEGGGDLAAGTRVVGEINAGCGVCARCVERDPRHCATRTVLGILGRDGAHADLLRLPARNLVRVPDAVTDQQAVFVEPLAAACAILDATAMTSDSRVAVLGDGRLGNLCAQVLHASRIPVVAIGKHDDKLRRLASRGIETCRVADASKLARRFHVVIEASGAQSGFDLALDLLEPKGALVLKSTFFGKTPIAAARIVIDEIRVIGSRCGRFAPALELLSRGAVDVDGLVSERFARRDGIAAMKTASKPGVMKVLLET